MSWYIWVWGTISTLSALAWVAVAGEAFRELREKRRNNYERRIQTETKIQRLEAQLTELRKGRNEFGRILP